MYALFWNGVRITDWYEGMEKLIRSDEYREKIRNKCNVEIRKA